MDTIKIFQFSILITHLLFFDFAVSEVYTVGDESGWNSGTGIDFLSWSEKYNFTVGDVLEFRYSKAQHNVKEVTNATYRSCDAGDGVIAVYKSGNDEIGLTEVRRCNFICDKDSHCLGGMRFSITVLEASRSNNTTTSVPPSPPVSSSVAAIRRSKAIHNSGIALALIFMLQWKF